jgi:hypothetical protein
MKSRWRLYSFFTIIPFIIASSAIFILPIKLWGNSEYFFEDDLFYYIEVAKNLSEGRGFSFDGLEQTTGFQLLWQILLVPIVTLGKSFGIYGPLGFTLFFNWLILIASMLVTLKVIGRVLGNLLASLAVSTAFVIALPYVFNGMETSLILLLIALILNSIQLLAINPESQLPRYALIVCTSLLISARMDMVFVVFAVMIMLLAFRLFKIMFIVLFSSCILSLVQVFIYYSLVGELLPISSQVKSWWQTIGIGNSTGKGLARNLLDVTFYSISPLSDQFSVLPVGATLSSTWGILTAPISILCLYIVFKRAKKFPIVWSSGQIEVSRDVEGVTALFTILLSGSVFFQIVYYTFFSAGMWPWYFGFPVLLWLLVTITVVLRLLSLYSTKLAALFAVGMMFFVTSSATINSINSAHWVLENGTWGKGILALDSWLSHNVPNSAPVGTWAAGQLGFLRDGRVVNLEGLVQDPSVLEANQNERLFTWIEENDIQYIANWFPIKSMISPIGQSLDCPRLVGEPFQDLRIKPLSLNCTSLNLVGAISLENPKNLLDKIYIWQVRP